METGALSMYGGLVGSGNKASNPANLLFNGGFESWSLGAAVAPDGWTLAGAGASAAREGTIIKLGTYSAKVVRSGANAAIYQDFSATRGLSYWKGRNVTLGCWVYATVASRGVLVLQDGGSIANAYSSYHTGNSTWQFLTVTKTVSSDASYLNCVLDVDAGDTSVYFDGAIAVEGSSIFAFSPKFSEEGAWIDTGSTGVVGWSSFTTFVVKHKRIGNLGIVAWDLEGTSNSGSIQIPLAWLPSSSTYTWCMNVDNNANPSVGGYAFTSGATLYVYRDTVATAFTATGTKKTFGTLVYPIT
jgi:hypothetical protein